MLLRMLVEVGWVVFFLFFVLVTTTHRPGIFARLLVMLRIGWW